MNSQEKIAYEQGLWDEFSAPYFGEGKTCLLYTSYSKKLHRGFFFGLCLTYIFTFRFFIEFLKENQEDFENSMICLLYTSLTLPEH